MLRETSVAASRVETNTGAQGVNDLQNEPSKTQKMRADVLDLFGLVVAPLQRGPDARVYRRASGKIGDALFQSLCARLGILNLVECGAYDAAASIIFKTSGGHRAVAIEANPNVFERKTIRAQSHGVEVRNVGLAAQTGTLKFFLPDGQPFPSSASFLSKNDRMAFIEVETSTLDAIAEELDLHGPLALWVDVEGFAYEVLQGARNTFADPACQVLKVEMEDVLRWQNQRTMAELAPEIEAFGFVPVFADIEFVGQFNVIYVKSQLLTDVEDLVDTGWRHIRELATTGVAPGVV